MKDTKIAQLETNLSRMVNSDQAAKSAQEIQRENGGMRVQHVDTNVVSYGRSPQMAVQPLQRYSPKSEGEQRSVMYQEANVSKVPLQVGSDESPIGVASVSTSNAGYVQRMPMQRSNEYYPPATNHMQQMQQMHPGRYDENQFF